MIAVLTPQLRTRDRHRHRIAARRGSLIGIIAPDSTVYLPGGTFDALVSGGTSQLAWITALGLTVRYGIIAFIISLVAFRSRDITS